MVTITINGKKHGREFQNMAQAVIFAHQNGECLTAKKLELVYAEDKAKTTRPAAPASGGKPETGTKGETNPQQDNPSGKAGDTGVPQGADEQEAAGV